MIITALVENTTSGERFGCEHGLSLYIQTQSCRILFDMGQSDLFVQNATEAGVDLRSVDVAVLSHGHYDHSGGLKTFLQLNDTAPVYLSRFAFEPHYNASGKYIGMDQTLNGHPRLIPTDGDAVIAEGITLFCCNDRARQYTADADGLSVMEEGVLVPDDFRHEQVMLIEENGKRVLISGCSHKGVLNYAAWFNPDVLIGGFHFMHTPIGKSLRERAEQLDRFDTVWYTCHCTGKEQYEAMKEQMRHLHYLSAGQSITV